MPSIESDIELDDTDLVDPNNDCRGNISSTSGILTSGVWISKKPVYEEDQDESFY